MPSLHDRAADIPLLVEYFIDRFGKKAGKKFKTIKRKSLQRFQAYGWRSNVRELQNVIERAVMSDGDAFSVDETWVKREPPQVASPRAALNGALLKQKKGNDRSRTSRKQRPKLRANGRGGQTGASDSDPRLKIKRLGINKLRFKVQQAS
jgi:formate hydrogenlyase transcriptional activator